MIILLHKRINIIILVLRLHTKTPSDDFLLSLDFVHIRPGKLLYGIRPPPFFSQV